MLTSSSHANSIIFEHTYNYRLGDAESAMVMSVLHLHEFTSLKSKAALFLKNRSKAGPELSLESVGQMYLSCRR